MARRGSPLTPAGSAGDGSFLLIAPAAAFVASVVGGALLLAVYVSLTDSTAGSLSGRFVGWENFEQAVGDPAFRRSAANTLIVGVVAPALALVPALALGHLLSRELPARWLLLTVILLPWTAPPALEAMAWRWILDSLFSVVNWALEALRLVDGADPPQWLGHPRLGMVALTAVHTWRLVPFLAVMVLAGLSSVPAEIRDAATVDGATGWARLRHVNLPFLMPVLALALLLGAVFSASGMAIVHVLTGGGPFDSTHVAGSWAYQVGISSGATGRGAAVSLMLLPVLAAASVGVLRFAARWDVGW